MIHPILKRLSHSSILLLHSCPRKYQLTKLLNHYEDEDDSDDLTYGSAIGHGIQQLLLGVPLEQVWLEIFCRWGMEIIDYDEKTARKRKTLWHAYQCLDIFENKYKPILLGEYDVATLRERAACELGFRIKIGNDYEYRGYVDVVLIHKSTKELVVLEIKTTGARFIHAAKYQNSGQGLGYSLICDSIAHAHPEVEGSSYKVLYLVFLTLANDFQFLPFPKSHSQRAIWIKQLLQEVEHIEGYDKDELWPMYGESCIAYNRPCNFFGTCHLSDSVLLAGRTPTLKEETYTFEISLMDLINAQLELSQEAVVL